MWIFLFLHFCMLCHGQKKLSLCPMFHFYMPSCRLATIDLWPCYPPSSLLFIRWVSPQSSCGAVLLQVYSLFTALPNGDSPCSKKVFVCVCVCHCGLGSTACAVISITAAWSLAEPLTSAQYNKLITQTFKPARCVGVLYDQTKLGFLDSTLDVKNSSNTHRCAPTHSHTNTTQLNKLD